jgi:glycosyltransferase involved in cell wall biosynthesis
VHVGLNLIYLVPGETGGMETYARELVPALLRERPNLRITCFLNRQAHDTWARLPLAGVQRVMVRVDVSRRIEWVRAEQQLLPPLAARAGVDVVHSLGSTGPAWGRFRRIVTIHDLIYRVYPEAHFGLRSLGMRFLVPLAARRSDRVIVPSQHTKDDLVTVLKIAPEKVDVVPEGVSVPDVPDINEPDLRARYRLGERRILLCASAKRPHKNLLRLLEALALLPPERRPLAVLPGYSTPHEMRLRERASELCLTADTRFLEWIPAQDLEGLYRLASCFVFPSLYEGFGLPVLEAMARGVPVACSDRASLPEVAGDAARMFDPQDPRAIADAVDEILHDASLRDRLRAAGTEQAKRFTWSVAARGTLQTYERVVSPS